MNWEFFRKLNKALLVAASLAATAWAQGVVDPQDALVWDGSNLVTLSRSTSSVTAAQLHDAQGRVIQKVSQPPRVAGWGSGRIFYAEGSFLWVRSTRSKSTTPEGSFFESEVLRLEGKSWNRLGRYRNPMGPVALMPLAGDRYLGVAVLPKVLELDRHSYPFAVLRLNPKGEFEVHDYLEGGFEQPFFNPGNKRNYSPLVMSLLLREHARTDRHLVLSSQYGHFWIFDLEKGHLRRVVSLYKGLDEKRLSEGNLVPGLLGLHPRQNGHVLIAARREEAVLLAGLAFRSQDFPTGEGNQDRWADAVQKRFPHVDWWDLDPETGQITSEFPPARVPDRLYSQAEVLDFNWRFKPDGNLLVYSQKEKNPPAKVEDLERLGIARPPDPTSLPTMKNRGKR